ncbi:probable LRR receptor-like serine/threonine-protein kinase At3g47570 [Vicia villosa]|uniref:probable LRR receptor-like serine/threonine-protein kinase At3g47570 n=1 Tax=Vicia villosa TaxID=3911 RepID=UPI00273C59A5|nr:probable LRR receptor-like serine/threonine-protein kinase At3g47570 [Vicia villosa]
MKNLLFCLFLFSFSFFCFFACSIASIKNISTDESALLAIKSLITSDPYNMLSNNWSSSYSVCNWVGISCDKKHNRVHSLNLTSMDLRGTLSPNIGNLSFLVILDLSNNSFGGQLPKEICWLRRLKALEVNHNEFVGGIPIALGELSQLVYLDLSFNNLNGFIPQSIHNLSKLVYLDFEKNSIEGTIPSAVGRLHRLKSLNIGENEMSGLLPKEISNLSSLAGLFLSSNSFSGPIPEEIGYLDQLEYLILANNSFNGSLPSKLLNISSLEGLYLEKNYFSGKIQSNTRYSLPKLLSLHLNQNNFVGNIPNCIFNASNLIQLQLSFNAFSGTLPNTAFGDLRFLEVFLIYYNDLTINDSFQFFTSLTNCRNLKYIGLSGNYIQSSLPKSIGNLTSESFEVDSCGINGNIPIEIGNMSNLLFFSLIGNNIIGPIPSTFKGLQKLQSLYLSDNRIKGSFIEELCEIKSLGELYLGNNKLSGVLPACLGNMTSLIKIHVGYNNLNSKIPTSLWSLRDILEVNLSSNTFIGNLPPKIGNLRAVVLLDLSRNHISSNIPTIITFLKTLQKLSLAHNQIYGSIPTSLGGMVSLISLDLSHNMLTGVIPKSLESLLYLQKINFSYNRLQGEIPDGGLFKNWTAQSFMHNEVLCGNPRLQVPPCLKLVKKSSKANKLLLKCMVPIVVSIIFIVGSIILLKVNKRKKVENTLERGLSTLGAPRRISYYELVQATNGFNESNLLGRGGFGFVYQGKLPDGEMIAVKVIDLQSEEISKSFDVECNTMRNLRHRNLIKIISSCSNLDFKSLVMEFLLNGSLEKWLYSNNYCLNFMQRLNIMIDVASALEYLHHDSSIPVVHCDLKPTNVLLDEDMVAHVSDFGIAKLMDEGQSKTHTQTLATIGYLAPEYGSKGIVSVKGDVYSYGIMLMEIFTRRKPTDDMFNVELSLKTWISGSLPSSIIEVVDSNLIKQNEKYMDDMLTCMSTIFDIALDCCENSPEATINMTDVSASLIKIKTMVLAHNEV